MKKVLSLFLFTFISYLAYSNAIVSQTEWRWRKDNGSETAATWASEQNESMSASVCSGENIRLRMAFQVDPDPSASEEATQTADYRISYSTSPFGPFTLIPANATNEHFELAESQYVSNGQVTTQQLSSTGGSFSAGLIITKNTTAGIEFSTPSGVTTLTEYEWVIKPTENTQQATYYFQLQGLDEYTAPLPQLNITPSTITGSTIVTNVSCNGGSNGSINLTPSGGTAPYTYDWGGGITTEDRTGLAAGSYSVIIADALGCTDTVQAIVTQPSALSASIASQTNIACNGGSNGSVSVTASGGAGDYSYSWSPSGGTAATATGLTAGSYTVTVTDMNGCTATATATITQPAAISASITSQTNIACNGGSNGSATVTASGGAGDYSYSWSPSGGTAATATGLTAGSYTATVTDMNGCTATATATLTQPVAINVTVVQDYIGCIGSNNGSASVTASGGTGNLYYDWSPSGGISATATNLAPGNYTVSVTDDNGCQVSTDVEIIENICTGIHNSASTELNNMISIYPNPLTNEGIVSISGLGDLKIERIVLIDAHGKNIMTVESQEKLMIQDLDAGMYMVEIVTDKGLVMKKLFIR